MISTSARVNVPRPAPRSAHVPSLRCTDDRMSATASSIFIPEATVAMQIHPMKTLVMLALLASPTVSLAQDDKLLKDLLAIETEIVRANRECDYKYFEYIEAPDFIFIDGNGGVTTRAQDLAGEKDCRKSDDNAVLDETRAVRYGDVAVFTARSSSTTKNAS